MRRVGLFAASILGLSVLGISVIVFSVIVSVIAAMSVIASVVFSVIAVLVIAPSVIAMALRGIRWRRSGGCGAFFSILLLEEELVERNCFIDHGSKGVRSSAAGNCKLYLRFEAAVEHAAFGVVVEVERRRKSLKQLSVM